MPCAYCQPEEVNKRVSDLNYTPAKFPLCLDCDTKPRTDEEVLAKLRAAPGYKGPSAELENKSE